MEQRRTYIRARTNKYGVRFTAKQVKRFNLLVRRANRIRKINLEKINTQTNMVGVQEDFYFGKQKLNLDFYRTKEEFNERLSKLREYTDFSSYKRRRDSQYFAQYKQTLWNVYGKDAEPLVDKLDELGEENFIKAQRLGYLDNLNYFEDSEGTSELNPTEKEINSEIERAIKLVGQIK